MNKTKTFLKKEASIFFKWSDRNPVGKIPKDVAKEGAGENRIPLAHIANSVPVYLVFKNLIDKSNKGRAFILDVGCGTGRNISFVKETLNKKNYQYYGVDYSKACIDYANSQYQKQKVIFVQHPKILPFPDESFDFIVSSHVLEHINKKGAQAFLTEILRVLKKGGKAVIGTPNRKFCQDLFYKNPKDEKRYRLILPHEHEFYYEEIDKLFNKNKHLFKSYSILQTINDINRKLMIESTNKIKPKPGLFNTLKFNLYLILRRNGGLQALMAKLGTEFILRSKKITYEKVLASTSIVSSKSDIGDNFVVVFTKIILPLS